MQEPAEFWKLTLGQPYWEGIASWPDERFEYRYFGGHHLLQLCLTKLSERDIAAFSVAGGVNPQKSGGGIWRRAW